MKESNKIKILLEIISELLNIKAKVPSDFDSIPTINNMGATHYDFEGYRNENDIHDLWTLFSVGLTDAMKKRKEQNIKINSSNTLIW